jgi:mannosyltransferase OCH1-like enzyme
MSNSFPKNIFQVWYQGCNNITRDDFKINIQNWKDFNPQWNYNCVDNKFIEDACKQFSEECYYLYKQSNLMHMKIDLGRYVLLYLYGGMYADIDAYILRPLEHSNKIKELIDIYEKQNKNVIGLSSINLNVLETFFVTYSFQSFTLNNAIMFSSPKNPTLKRFIESIIVNIKNHLKDNSDSYSHVQNTTGPRIFNNFFTNNKNTFDTNIIVFEPSIFEPCSAENYCTINENTISIHVFEKSWIPSTMHYIAHIYYFFKPYIIPIIIFIIWYFFYKK